MVCKDKIQKRARRNHMQFRHFFVKVTQGGKNFRSGLDFVDKQQGISGYDRNIELQGQQTYNFFWAVGLE